MTGLDFLVLLIFGSCVGTILYLGVVEIKNKNKEHREMGYGQRRNRRAKK